MNKLNLFLVIVFSFYLLIMQLSFSQEDNIKIMIRRFAPGLNLSIPQGSWERLDFFIENTYNQSLIIFYRFEKPSGIEIETYPSKYYSLDPKIEFAGNLNISVDPYLDNRSYTIIFWIDTLEKLENSTQTIRSNKFSINLNVLSNPPPPLNETTTTTTTTTTVTNPTPNTVPIETLTTVLITELPTIVPPTVEGYGKISYKEYLLIFAVLMLLLILPFMMLRKSTTKEKPSTFSPEATQA